MIYHVRHRSQVNYAASIAHAQFNLRLHPIDWPGQVLRSSSLTLDPMPATRSHRQGPYLTNVTQISFRDALDSLEVLSEFEMEVEHGPAPVSGPSLDELRKQFLTSREVSNQSPLPYLFTSRIAGFEPDIAEWSARLVHRDDDVIGAARRITSAVHGEFDYVPGVTTSSTPPGQCFESRKGVCQDFAHVMIIALRAHGIPAAYASGYLRTEPAPGMEKLVGADAMHAWVTVWCGEELGWVGFDPTNDCIARNDHILVAMGRDYADVAPIDGVFIGQALQKMKVWVDVTPIAG